MGILFKIIIILLFGYIIYILGIRPFVIKKMHKEDNEGIELPEDFDNITLLEYLHKKNFNYPELKNIRHNELGQIVIEGKYTSHPLVIKEQKLYVGRGEKGGKQKEAKCILEAVVITHYLSKFFDPNSPVDAYMEYKSFKVRRKQPVIVKTSLYMFLIIIFAYALITEGNILDDYNSHSISSSYLTDYSTTKTIGDSFDEFFGDPKWKRYEQGIQKYVDFQGLVHMDDEPAIAVITFSVSVDHFMVESIKVDNRALNAYEVDSFLKKVLSTE